MENPKILFPILSWSTWSFVYLDHLSPPIEQRYCSLQNPIKNLLPLANKYWRWDWGLSHCVEERHALSWSGLCRESLSLAQCFSSLAAHLNRLGNSEKEILKSHHVLTGVSKWRPWPGAPRSLLEMHVLRPQPRRAQSETGCGAQHCVNWHSRVILVTFGFVGKHPCSWH